jgi:hypothetical protein
MNILIISNNRKIRISDKEKVARRQYGIIAGTGEVKGCYQN